MHVPQGGNKHCEKLVEPCFFSYTDVQLIL